MAENNDMAQREVSALREEVKNLASQLDTAVRRIQELESQNKPGKPSKPAGSDLTFHEEVQALREEVRNLANALNTAVERVRELEGD